MKFPVLMAAMALAMTGVFGANNNPIMTTKVGALLLDGIQLCANPGLFGAIACAQIRPLAAEVQNIEEQEGGILEFSILRYPLNLFAHDIMEPFCYYFYTNKTCHCVAPLLRDTMENRETQFAANQ
ncbi:jg8134 [Pararge aegeria aegeria]|uniref:Jg8134 protein n=1 Tax=Pararge aegeria aegeria TaxID=348720 RepID=A0A8S4QNL3_9NEOP|nr:jg8134 [Pararge aegeria aegeria]